MTASSIDPGRRPIPARNMATAKAVAAWLAHRGVTPNQVSLLGLLAGVASGGLMAATTLAPGFARLMWFAAAVAVLLRGLCNMFDGMVAVEHGRATRAGLLYNEIPDRVSDVALMVGAGYAVGGDPLAGWCAACLALLVTIIRLVGTMAEAPPDFGGLMAKQQRMYTLAGFSLYLSIAPAGWQPNWGPDGRFGVISIGLWIVAAGSALTIVGRLRRALRALR